MFTGRIDADLRLEAYMLGTMLVVTACMAVYAFAVWYDDEVRR
ncbi:hypothetical protein [Arvimicrobium flavum]|nr:hypothetical protein [Mesorhizobium shangrilense]